MKIKTIINTNEVPFGSELFLKDGRTATVNGVLNSMLPTIEEIYKFYTDIGTVLPDEVERIL